MKYLIFLPVFLLSLLSQGMSQQGKPQSKSQRSSSESLSSLMGAISHIIEDKTKIPGKTNPDAKLSPPAAGTLKALENDLENCQTSKTFEPQVARVEKSGVQIEFKKFDLRIYGENCPMELNASIKAEEENPTNLTAHILMQMTFKKQTFIDKYKLRFIELKGILSAKALQEGNIVKIPVKIEFKGQGDSVDLGPVKQEISIDFLVDVNLAEFNFNMTSEQKAFLTYQDISKKGYSKVKMNGFSEPEALYKIDDKEVSHSEFKLFLDSFTIPGMISDEEPAPPDAQAPTQCHFAVFEKNSITSEALKTQLQSSQLQSEGLLTQGNSCLKDLSVSFKKDPNSYSGDLQFGPEWISFTGTSKISEKLNGGVYILYGDKAVQTNESEELLMGLKCQAVPSCL